MSVIQKIKSLSNNSFPNVTENYEMKVSGTDSFTANNKKYFLVLYKGKRLSDGADAEHASIVNKEATFSPEEMNEVIMVNTTAKEDKLYPKIELVEAGN